MKLGKFWIVPSREVPKTRFGWPAREMSENNLETNCERLARWVVALAEEPIRPTKLQRLMFYCYGAALAHGLFVGDITFRKWAKGPVCVSIYYKFQSLGADFIPSCELEPLRDSPLLPMLSPELLRVLRDTITVYGSMSEWQLSQESLEEKIVSSTEIGSLLEKRAIEEHFKEKFAPGNVFLPVCSSASQNLRLSGIPQMPCLSLRELASGLRGDY